MGYCSSEKIDRGGTSAMSAMRRILSCGGKSAMSTYGIPLNATWEITTVAEFDRGDTNTMSAYGISRGATSPRAGQSHPYQH